MVRLCSGTFLDVLLQCALPKFRKTEFVNEIVKTIDPQSKYIVEKGKSRGNPVYGALNDVYKCECDFAPEYTSVIELAPRADRNEVIKRFADNVVSLIDKDKSEQVVLALCYIIENDNTLNSVGNGENKKKFQDCTGGIDVQSFLNAKKNDLPEFLASVFLYTVTAVKNTEGREWIKEICNQHKKYEDYFIDLVNRFKVELPSDVDIPNSQETICMLNEETVLEKNAPAEQQPQAVQMADLPSDSQIDDTSSETGTPINTTKVNNRVKKTQSVWDMGLEPVFMPEDFYKYFNKYAIADFVKFDPMDLILINYMVAEERPDGEAMIKNAIQFVKEIENDIQRSEISFLNEKVCKAISAYVKSLREYIDFLMENAESPDFNILPFLLKPVDTDEFERKAVKHRRKLQSIYRQITNVEGRWGGLHMYSNFPGQ